QVSPDTPEVREGQPREAHAEWVINGFRDLEAVPAVRGSLLEDAALGEGAGEVGATPHRREGGQAKALSAPVAPEQLLVSGRWLSAVSACSKYAPASRLADRAKALAPACRR